MKRGLRWTKRLGSALRTFLLGWALIVGMVGYTVLLGTHQVYRRSVRLGGDVVAAGTVDPGTAGRTVYRWIRS